MVSNVNQTIHNIPEDLKLENYHYHLPEERIAQRPAVPRDAARLLVYDQSRGRIEHAHFHQLAKFLPERSLVVANQSKVFPCRLVGRKPSGGKAEVFFLKTDHGERGFPALVRTSGGKKVGDVLVLEGGVRARIEKICPGGYFELSLDCALERALERGHMPIPPYIRKGESDQRDVQDYQTFFATQTGSVAAPTAGLHFTPRVLDSLKQKSIGCASITLHVGVGTFAPVKSESISEHQMHPEEFCVEEEDWAKIQRASFKTLVGTTSLRALESFASLKQPRVGTFYQTDLFLHPGKTISACDALITNFHLPRSTLLMLVCALLGRHETLEIYQEAVREGYRFLSYGDAMLILRESV